MRFGRCQVNIINMKIISGFLSLPVSKRYILLKLLWFIIKAEIVFSLLPYSSVRKLAFKQKPIKKVTPSNQKEILKCHLILLKKICRNLPIKITCLRQAVALRDSLASEGIEAFLKIGVSCNMGELNAHAWIECCGYEVLKNGTYSLLTPNKECFYQNAGE